MSWQYNVSVVGTTRGGGGSRDGMNCVLRQKGACLVCVQIRQTVALSAWGQCYGEGTEVTAFRSRLCTHSATFYIIKSTSAVAGQRDCNVGIQNSVV